MKPLHGLVLGTLLLGCLCGRAWAVETPPSATHEAMLWRLAEKAQSEEEQHLVLVRPGPLQDYLDGVVELLWAHAQTTLPPMRVRVIEDSELKAYTYPNGVCYISSGMLSQVQSEDQLAMILAHEMIHYVQRHTLKAHGRFALPFAHGGAERAALGRADGPGRGASLGRFVQAAEEQADREGLELMRRSGYCPEHVLAMLASFKASAERSAEQIALDRRMAQFRAVIKNQPTHHPCPDAAEGHRAYRQHIAPALIANARAAMQRGQWELALRSVSQYLDIRPRNPQAHFILGQAQSHRSVPDAMQKAMAAYQEAIHLDRKYSAPYGALGMLQFKAGHKRAARQYFETYLALAPRASESAYIREYLKLCHE